MKRLNIFIVIGGQAASTTGNKIWIRNLHDPLVDLGYKVFLLNIDTFLQHNNIKPLTGHGKEFLSDQLYRIFTEKHESEKFDIFFSYLHSGQIDPDVMRKIAKKIFTVNFTTNFHQFEMYSDIAKNVHVNISIYNKARLGFKDVGAEMYYMPLAINPNFYKPYNGRKKTNVVFIGSNYGNRPYYLWRILESMINLQVYGSGWRDTVHISPRNRIFSSLKDIFYVVDLPSLDDQLRILDQKMMTAITQKLLSDYPEYIHMSVGDDEMVRNIGQAAICLNISQSRFKHDFINPRVIFGHNLKDFEATACKTMLYTNYYPEIEEFFIIGKEISIFYNESDLIDKLKFYLNHKDEREKIALAGYKRTLKDHTWHKRYLDFFEYLETNYRYVFK